MAFLESLHKFLTRLITWVAIALLVVQVFILLKDSYINKHVVNSEASPVPIKEVLRNSRDSEDMNSSLIIAFKNDTQIIKFFNHGAENASHYADRSGNLIAPVKENSNELFITRKKDHSVKYFHNTNKSKIDVSILNSVNKSEVRGHVSISEDNLVTESKLVYEMPEIPGKIYEQTNVSTARSGENFTNSGNDLFNKFLTKFKVDVDGTPEGKVKQNKITSNGSEQFIVDYSSPGVQLNPSIVTMRNERDRGSTTKNTHMTDGLNEERPVLTPMSAITEMKSSYNIKFINSSAFSNESEEVFHTSTTNTVILENLTTNINLNLETTSNKNFPSVMDLNDLSRADVRVERIEASPIKSGTFKQINNNTFAEKSEAKARTAINAATHDVYQLDAYPDHQADLVAAEDSTRTVKVSDMKIVSGDVKGASFSAYTTTNLKTFIVQKTFMNFHSQYGDRSSSIPDNLLNTTWCTSDSDCHLYNYDQTPADSSIVFPPVCERTKDNFESKTVLTHFSQAYK
ncbi:uncharacterized protein LOC108667442 [Hyalella azteca]|uniref:Uncharacterized protein LOC108667442 n=1 Tax=Hyalella azteca TaxID=294128 RepID=A0A8B7N9D6_HYAAZ|nr:uncharacterized protein LOC108667442 [Hyalella azteca]